MLSGRAAAGLAAVLLAMAALLTPVSSAPAGASATVAARPSAGCALTTPVAPGTADLLLAAGGDSGAYVREVPHSYSGQRPLPLVIDLHGYEESATLQASLTQLGAYGDRHGFITVTPQVAGPVLMWLTSLGSKDLAFFGGLLRTLDATLCVDRNRTYVTGYSNGAMMASSIACQFAGQIAAVAPVSGLENPAGCHPSRPVPIVTFHGTADQYVSYAGGLGPAALKLPAPDGSQKDLGQELGAGSPQRTGPSIPSITATWAARNGCRSGAHDHRVASDVTLIDFHCPPDGTVELYRVAGGGHAWPGSTLSKSIAAAVGHTTFSISANQVMWQFFESHPLRP